VQADYARCYRTLWERHWWWRSRESYLLGWIERLHRDSPRRKILDVGCGDGLFFEQLARFGEVDGLEPDARLVSDPRWRSRIRVDTLDSRFEGAGEYDLLLMLDVLEHIGDDADALRAARAALRPGGHLLLTVPALSWLWSRHDVANEHHRRYDPSGLRAALVASGFEVELVRFFFFWTVAPLLARRWLAPAKAGAADYAVPIPPGPINRALILLCRGEQALGRFVRWPLGSSLLAIARRPAGPVPRHRNLRDPFPEARGCSSRQS
jgi:SAM-dependent methyltransferase